MQKIHQKPQRILKLQVAKIHNNWISLIKLCKQCGKSTKHEEKILKNEWKWTWNMKKTLKIIEN